MRIESLQVERFGRFHNFRPEPFGGGLTVLYGRNEAGKSTLLAFVRSVLFGFPTSRSKENRYEPWCGGTVQGTLDLRTRDGVLYRVSRTSGPKGGPVQVFREGRRLEGGQALESLLGPISPEVFRKVFAFSLWELQDLGALNEGEVREALYGAGSGGIRVASVEKVLCDEAQRLFKSGGNAKAPLNQALREIDQREKSLAELRRLPADYDRKVTRVEELTLELTGLAGQAENLLGCRGRVQALLQAWPVQARILDLQAEIAAIPALETFPSEGVSRLESLEAHQDRLNLDLARSRHGLEDLRKRLEACPVDPRILAVTEPIARLQGSRERWEERSHRLPALEERLRSEQETLTREMGDLGTGWNEERVRAQDLSVGLRERLERGRTALAEAETTHREAARRLKEAEEATERCAERVSSGQEALARVRAGDPRLAGLDAASLASAQEAARRLREEVEAVERAGEAAREACAGLPEGWARMRRPGQEELRERWRQLQELQEKAREAGQKVAQATEARDEARERVSRIQRTLEALPHPKLQTEDEVRARREDLRRARHLQGQLRELDLARQAAVTRVQDLVRTGIPVPARLVGVVALVVVGLGIGLVWQRQALAGGVCVFVGLLLGALAWWLRGRRHDESCALEAARADLAQREEALEKARQQALGRPSGQDLERAEAEFADELEKLSRWRAAGESLGQAQDDRTRLQGKVEAAEKLAVQAQQAAKEGREAWDAWCRQQHLPADGPESQAEFLARLDGARSARRQLEAVQERSGRARKALDQARNLLAAPLAELGRKLPEAAPELLDFLVRLAAEAEQARLAIGSAQDLRSRHELDVQALGEARDNNKKAAGACELARQALEAARQAWARLAVGAGLDAGLSPELALVVLWRLD